MIYNNWIVIWLVTSFLFALPVHRCYSVSRMTSGDIVRDFVSNCSEIYAENTNATGCLCSYNGTFISHQNLSSCHPNVNKQDALGLRNIYSVPLAKLINGTWRLPNRPMMFLRNNQTVNKKRCPSLFIDSNHSNYEYMVNYGWRKAYEYNFFWITTDAMDNYHMKLLGDSMYWGGFLVRVWLDCRTNSSEIKFSFLLKFKGEGNFCPNQTLELFIFCKLLFISSSTFHLPWCAKKWVKYKSNLYTTSSMCLYEK